MSEIVRTLADCDPQSPVPLIDLVAQYRSIEAEVLPAVERVFSSQRFILGDEVAEFEFEVAEYCGAREAIGCASGTDALILALMALDIGPGDEVVTTPYTFFATGSSICRVGARPVFVDIDPLTYNLDPAAVAAAITPRMRAIMPVHLFGQCADMDALQKIAVQARLPIVEDACQAIGAEHHHRRAGTLGTIGCFSFFPTKNLGAAGDAGLLTTDDATLAKRLRRLRVHGDAGQYEHIELGLNSRLDALQAAVLRIKLKRLDAWTAARERNARRYANFFAAYDLLDAVVLPTAAPHMRHVFNQYCVRIPGARDKVLAGLRERQIGCTIYYPKPLHLQPCFANLGYQPGSLPNAELAALESLALPVYPELTESQQDRVVQGIAHALGRTPRRTLQNVLPRPNFLAAGRVGAARD
ncbi:MAG: DegT/DnrJ/EryC1/StrS family aminotransferase [Planctomycetaceae bacterium]